MSENSTPDAPDAPDAPQQPMPRPPRPMRHYAAAAITAALMALVLGWLLYRERAALAAIELTRAWPRLLAGQAIMLITLVVAALVWASIMHALGSRVARRDHIHIYASTFLSRYLPGTVWYVVGRSAFYKMEGDSARMVTLGSSIELLLSTMAGALVALMLAVVSSTQTPALALPAMGLLVGLGVVALHPRVLAAIRARLHMSPLPPLRTSRLGLWLLADALNWLLGGVIFWLIASEIDGVALNQFAYTSLAWTLVGVLSVVVFVLPSNFGLTEVGLSLLLSAIMPSSLAVVVAVLTRVLMTIFSALACGMIVAATTLWRRQRAASAA